VTIDLLYTTFDGQLVLGGDDVPAIRRGLDADGGGSAPSSDRAEPDLPVGQAPQAGIDNPGP
jgi:hypothetical protein